LGPRLKLEPFPEMKRNYGDLTTKAQLTLIASALLLLSNIASAQAPSAGAQEQQAPTAKMTGQGTGPYGRRDDVSWHKGSWHDGSPHVHSHDVRLNGY
jgi:hypothetical protein